MKETIEKRQDIYYRNSRFFMEGETDLENPRPSHRTKGAFYYTATCVPFKVLRDMEYLYFSGGASEWIDMPKGIYRVIRIGDPENPSIFLRLGDDYTPEQKNERDNYWRQKNK